MRALAVVLLLQGCAVTDWQREQEARAAGQRVLDELSTPAMQKAIDEAIAQGPRAPR